MSAIDPKTTLELEAAAFRRLVAHLRERTDVQNIDLMNLAGFCRNCLANWYREAAEEKASPSPRRNRARSSTACRMRNGSSATRPKHRPKRRPPSPRVARIRGADRGVPTTRQTARALIHRKYSLWMRQARALPLSRRGPSLSLQGICAGRGVPANGKEWG